jgi:hypothetical protein
MSTTAGRVGTAFPADALLQKTQACTYSVTLFGAPTVRDIFDYGKSRAAELVDVITERSFDNSEFKGAGRNLITGRRAL